MNGQNKYSLEVVKFYDQSSLISKEKVKSIWSKTTFLYIFMFSTINIEYNKKSIIKYSFLKSFN